MYYICTLENSGVDSTHRAKGIEVMATWIKDGVWSAIGSAITGPLAGISVTHWFVVIKT